MIISALPKSTEHNHAELAKQAFSKGWDQL